jgi:SAM-dependent methyltransferase
VDTSGFIPGWKLFSGHVNDLHNTAYGGTAPSLFRALLARWQATLPANFTASDYTFIDIGSGKGRVIMLASELPFQRVIGVELNPQLAEVARRNLEKWATLPHPCSDITVLTADALAFPFPEAPTVLFLFHTFGAPVMELFMDRLVTLSQVSTFPIDLLYENPAHADLITRAPGVRVLWEGEIPFSDEDAAVGLLGDRAYRCGIYRLAGKATS